MGKTLRSPSLTLIVPCFNGGKYARKCIASIKAQTYADFEVVIIDDGSTDNSSAIINNIIKDDERFRLIQKENGGVSSARNIGIELARGQWITFADIDDTLPEDAFETLISTAKGATDVVFGGFKMFRDGKGTSLPPLDNEPKTPLVLASELFAPTDFIYQGFVWGKLFKRQIIETHSLRFSTEITYNEDRLFCLEYLTHAAEGVYTTKPVYNYYLTSQGAMGQINGTKYRQFETDLDAFLKMYSLGCRFGSSELMDMIRSGAFKSWLRNRELVKRYGGNNHADQKRLRNKISTLYNKWYIRKFLIKDKYLNLKTKIWHILH